MLHTYRHRTNNTAANLKPPKSFNSGSHRTAQGPGLHHMTFSTVPLRSRSSSVSFFNLSISASSSWFLLSMSCSLLVNQDNSVNPASAVCFAAFLLLLTALAYHSVAMLPALTLFSSSWMLCLALISASRADCSSRRADMSSLAKRRIFHGMS